MLETHVPMSTLGEYVSFHVLFKRQIEKVPYGLYGLYVTPLSQWSDINAFYSAASLEYHGDSAAFCAFQVGRHPTEV